MGWQYEISTDGHFHSVCVLHGEDVWWHKSSWGNREIAVYHGRKHSSYLNRHPEADAVEYLRREHFTALPLAAISGHSKL
jgi:hypothetical protein